MMVIISIKRYSKIRMSEEAWQNITNDVKAAIDKVFWSLQVKCSYGEQLVDIDYYPPFYLDEKCNEIMFGFTC